MKNLCSSALCLLSFALLAGCVTAPANDKQTIGRVRSVTVFCCDFKNDAPLLPESNISAVLSVAGAFTGGAVGAVASGVVQAGVTDYRSTGFYKAVGTAPFTPHEPFVAELKQALESAGVAVTVRFPSFFDGYLGRYVFDAGEVATDAVLEVRHIAAIAHTSDRYYPTIGASFRLLLPDRRVLTDGVVGTTDSGQKLSWGEIHPFGALALSLVHREHRSVRTKPHLIALAPEMIVIGDSDKLYAQAGAMYRSLVETNAQVARKVAKEALLKD